MSKELQSPGMPDFEARQAMWAAVDFRLLDAGASHVANYVEELRPLYANGRVEYGLFEMPSHPVLDWYVERNRYHEANFFEKFWDCPGVRERFPYGLNGDINFYERNVFAGINPFVLGGELAAILFRGGAYHGFERGGVEAKRLGDEAAWELLAGRYEDVPVYCSCVPWSEFFLDVAWDNTFVVINARERLVHVLMATDTD